MRRTYPLDHAFELSREEVLALVGGKAANLREMIGLGLPVPPGFVVTTETCRAFLAGGWPDGLDDELRERMAGVEAAVGRRFGDAADPLLVSVRSGAPVSMPGMMDTILDLGLNDATEAGLARASGSEAFARSCRDRFEASFRSIVGVGEVPDDPWEQLRLAIEAVFRSWNSDRARAYRAKEGIADDLGTAVTVQAMVFGNRGATSATGVAFTRNPATGEPTLYGDVLFDAQGEDVVAGTHATEPIAALDERLPAVAAELRETAARLERHYADLCDIEFTIEDGRLWFLQVRVGKRSPQAALRIAVDMAEDPAFPLSRAEAVARVARLLADPPTTTRRPDRRREALRDRAARVARDGVGRDRHEPGGGRRRGRGRTRRHPRPCRDLARGRPRDGPSRRHPDLARAGWRATPPSWRAAGGSRPWSAPRISRSATARSSSVTASSTPATSSPSTVAPARSSKAPSPARPRSCPRRRRSSRGPPSSASRSAAMTPRRPGRRATPQTTERGHARRLPPRDRHQGLRPAAGRRRRRPRHA